MHNILHRYPFGLCTIIIIETIRIFSRRRRRPYSFNSGLLYICKQTI